MDFAKIDSAFEKAAKIKVFVQTPIGSMNFSSLSLAISGEWGEVEQRRLSLCNVAVSKYRHRETSYGKTESWHETIPTARADADLLAELWNNAAELIRLAKIGARVEAAGLTDPSAHNRTEAVREVG